MAANGMFHPRASISWIRDGRFLGKAVLVGDICAVAQVAFWDLTTATVFSLSDHLEEFLLA
jgi:hypothetical protein